MTGDEKRKEQAKKPFVEVTDANAFGTTCFRVALVLLLPSFILVWLWYGWRPAILWAIGYYAQLNMAMYVAYKARS